MLPHTYRAHPVTQSKGEDCSVALGYFSDAVPHTKRDSFFCFYWSNLLTHTRYLICVVRKSDLCKCGCKGFCTLGTVSKIIAWSFNALATGEYPAFDHNGLPFQDGLRAAQRGTLIAAGVCGALCEMRADLLEFVGACGFKTWSNADHPCFCCSCERGDLFEFRQAKSWLVKDGASYDEMVRRSCIKVHVVSSSQLAELIGALCFDERYAGLALADGFPALGLPVGARLLQDGPVIDVHRLEHLAAPCSLSFFDSKGDHGLNLIFPLFQIVGFGIDSLALDVMHVLDLGVTQYFVALVFARLIVNDFAGSGKPIVFINRAENLRHLRRRMWAYYKTQKRNRATMSQIRKLTLPMLGNLRQPRLRAKAAETRNLVPLCVSLCQESFQCLGKNKGLIKLCAESLRDVYETMDQEPRVMSQEGLNKLRSRMFRFLQFWKASGGHLVYKHHCAWHLVQRAGAQGNPRLYWTYADERLNRTMGTVAKSLHGGPTFYKTFLEKVLE